MTTPTTAPAEQAEPYGKLIQLAAAFAQRLPLRSFDALSESTHIGHRQFGRAYAAADEEMRLAAIKLRDIADSLHAVVEASRAVRAEPTVVARPLEWEEHPSGKQWTDKHIGFCITYEPEDDPEDPYVWAWGEGDVGGAPTLEAAKAACQRDIDSWVQKIATHQPQAAEPGWFDLVMNAAASLDAAGATKEAAHYRGVASRMRDRAGHQPQAAESVRFCTCDGAGRGPGRACSVKAGNRLGDAWTCREQHEAAASLAKTESRA